MENDQAKLAQLVALLEQALNIADDQGFQLIALRISEGLASSKQIMLQPDRRIVAASQRQNGDTPSDAAGAPVVRDAR